MRKILSKFVKYPFYGKIFISMFIIFGIASMMNMNKASFPVVESKTIRISVSYQGATPKEMEEGVVTLIENALRGIVGIKEYSSTSQENSASVTVTVKNNYDVDKVLYDVKNAVDGISNFPAGAERAVVSKSRTTTIAMFVSLSSNDDDLIKLKDEAYIIEDEFLSSGVISQITINGIPSRMEMSIEINQDMMERYSISLNDIKNAVASYNVDVYGGVIKNPKEQIKINIRNRSVNPDDIEQIVIRANENGSLVRIKDLGKVVLQFEDLPKLTYLDGRRDVLFFITNLKEENLQETSDYINDYVKKYNEKNSNMKLKIVRDFMSILDGQLSILYGNGIMGILLVVLALSLFLNFRMSLWVAWGIPAAFLGMFIMANILGVSLNMISLFGMILIIGILVDDGIVIGENIFTYYEKGEDPRVAAIKGTLEVLPAVIISVLTTIIAFIPILFIQGNLQMMYEMAIVVIFCLLFSLVESVFVLPGHLASKKVLDPQGKKKSLYSKIRAAFDKGMNYSCNRIYVPFLKWSLNKKVIMIAITTSMFLITAGLYLGGRISFTFVPPSNEDNFVIDIATKPGTSVETVLEILEEMEKTVRKADTVLMERYNEESFIQSLSKQTGSAFSGNEVGEHAGILRLFLRRLDRSKVSSDIVKKEVTLQLGQIPEAYKFAVGASSRFGAPVSISLFSRNTATLLKASNELKTELNKISSLYNIMDNNQLGSREVHLKLKPLAYTLGLTPSEIISQVRASFFGSLAQRVQEGRSEIWFYVRYPESDRQDFGDLEKMKLRTAKGGEYPLSQVCDFEIKRGVTKINHFNGKKEIRVEAFMLDAKESVLPVLEELNGNILPQMLQKYPDLTYMHQGQVKDSQEEMMTILIYFGLAFVVIILILVIYYRSLLQGFLVISMVPLSFLAAIWGHLAENTPLSMMSIWGMIALSGTIINNAVVFLSRYNDCLVANYSVVDAIVETGRSRFRPIMLTSITTTLGLFPLINETSSDAKFVIPMAISLGYGILLGTIFILAIFPVMIKSSNSIKLVWTRLLGNKQATSESVEVAVKDAKISKELMSALSEDDKADIIL